MDASHLVQQVFPDLDVSHAQQAGLGGGNGASLDDLPTEMLMNIVDSIPRTETSTLHSLSCINRRFHQLVEPFLYHTIVYNAAENRPLYYLMRTLLGRPSLAHHVKAIEILDWEDPISPVRLGQTTDDIRDVHAAMAKKSTEFNFNYQPWLKQSGYWKSAIVLGLDNAVVALFLFMTPNVERIELYKFKCTVNIWFFQLLVTAHKNPGLEPSWFRHLKELRVDSQLRLNITNLPRSSHALSDTAQGLSSLFCLPFLSKLDVHGMATEDYKSHSWPKQPSNITTLIVDSCDLPAHSVEAMIHACKALKTFEWHSLMVFARRDSLRIDASFRQISSALQHHKATLESLVVSKYPGERAQNPIDPILGDLSDFLTLKTLRVALDTICGRFRIVEGAKLRLADALPPNLEVLELECVWDFPSGEDYEDLEGLEEAYKALVRVFAVFVGELYRFPQLKTVRVSYLTLKPEIDVSFDTVGYVEELEVSIRPSNKPSIVDYAEEIERMFANVEVSLVFEDWRDGVKGCL